VQVSGRDERLAAASFLPALLLLLVLVLLGFLDFLLADFVAFAHEGLLVV
jgi:hypothetical protein